MFSKIKQFKSKPNFKVLRVSYPQIKPRLATARLPTPPLSPLPPVQISQARIYRRQQRQQRKSVTRSQPMIGTRRRTSIQSKHLCRFVSAFGICWPPSISCSKFSCSKFWLHSRHLSAPVKPAPDFGHKRNHGEDVFQLK